MLLGLRIGIEGLKAPLQDERDLRDLSLEDKLQRLFVNLLSLCTLLGEHLVAGKERLDSLDTDRNEVSPGNVANTVLVSESEKDTNIIFAEVIGRKQLEGFIELHVGKLTALGNISLGEKFRQGSLESFDETRRLNVDLL